MDYQLAQGQGVRSEHSARVSFNWIVCTDQLRIPGFPTTKYVSSTHFHHPLCHQKAFWLPLLEQHRWMCIEGATGMYLFEDLQCPVTWWSIIFSSVNWFVWHVWVNRCQRLEYIEFMRNISFPCRIPCRHSAMTGAKGVPPIATSNTPQWSSTATMGSILFSASSFQCSFTDWLLATQLPNNQLGFSQLSPVQLWLLLVFLFYMITFQMGSVKYVRIIPNLSVTVCRFFQSFLAMWVSTFLKFLY